MNLLITSKELTDIDSFLNITMSENAEEAVLRGNDLAVYVARSGKLLADAKYWLNEAMNSETMKTLAETAKNAKATATAINALVNSLCREERYLVDWCEQTKMLNDQEAPKYLLWLLIAIILMGLDENITGFPFIMGAGIIIYLFINMLILTSKDEPKKENNGNCKN